jgi:hypothetical protein
MRFPTSMQPARGGLPFVLQTKRGSRSDSLTSSVHGSALIFPKRGCDNPSNRPAARECHRAHFAERDFLRAVTTRLPWREASRNQSCPARGLGRALLPLLRCAKASAYTYVDLLRK